MRKRSPRRGEPLTERRLEEALAAGAADAVEMAGLVGRRGKRSSSIAPVPRRAGQGTAGARPDADRIPMGFTIGAQDTDSWQISRSDGVGREVKYLTDVEVDYTTLRIYCRVRTMKIDPGGHVIEVTGESDRIEWAQIERCGICTSV